jgi:Tol biopolymer transport system component
MGTSLSKRVLGALVAAALLPALLVACGDAGSGAARIVFGSARDGGGLYVMDADGGNVTWVPVPSGGSYPDWAPDGRIAFTRADNSDPRNIDVDIYVTAADGTGYGVLIDGPGWDLEPAWAPNGESIAFTSDRDGEHSIYLAKADGSFPMLLVEGATRPAWSPDGTKIAFVSARDGNTDIYVIAIAGGEVTRLTDNAAVDSEPAWSPDGTRIAFISGRDGDIEIYVMDEGGSNVIRLTNSDGLDAMPAWSPDGTRIAFVSEREGNWDIFVMESDGSGVTRLTDHPLNDVAPAWGG